MKQQIINDIIDAIKGSGEKTKPYDSTAQVVRIEGDIIWVHIPGGVEETPVKRTINAQPGDNVTIRVSGGSAWITGNSTAPPTDDREAIAAKETATQAQITAVRASDDAERAYMAASSAVESAGIAAAAADDALESAHDANTYANNALIGLSTLESVIDTVNWFAEHKKASTDTTVVPDKTYYEYDAQTGTLSAVTPEGNENPSQEGWWELDEAIANYVASHVATTNDGLYVVGSSNGWKVLVSSGAGNFSAGIFLIDPNGGIALASTANGITFDEDKPFYIGDDNASIVFDGSGHISISGSGVTIGGARQ